MVCSSLSTRDDCQQRSKHTPGWKDRHWPVLLWCNQAAVFFKQSFTGKGTRCAGLAHLLGAGLRGVSWVCKYWVPVFPRKGPRHTFLDVWTQPFCPHGPGHRGKSSNTEKVLQRAQLSTGISQPMEVQEILADTLFQVAPPQRMQGRLNSPQDAWGSLGASIPTATSIPSVAHLLNYLTLCSLHFPLYLHPSDDPRKLSTFFLFQEINWGCPRPLLLEHLWMSCGSPRKFMWWIWVQAT